MYHHTIGAAMRRLQAWAHAAQGQILLRCEILRLPAAKNYLAGVSLPALNRLANSRYDPGTNSGS